MIPHLRHVTSITPLLCWTLLYGALSVCATWPARAQELPTVKLTPNIALLLPLESPTFGRYADAVRQGFLAAASVQGQTALPIRVYPSTESPERLLATYRQAVDAGAELIVGPLTRDGAAAIASASSISVPTLALNFPASQAPMPALLYVFGLNIDAEARQIAQLARAGGHRTALVISDGSPLGKRMHDAFAQTFTAAGDSAVTDVEYDDKTDDLDRLRRTVAAGSFDMVFLALTAERARIVCPYLPRTVAIYATSQITAAGTGPLIAHDLDQVTFVDMPWLLLADHPAVMIYPHPDFGGASDLERMYALGIDAFRIGIELLRQNPAPVLDGVTGRIRLVDHQFTRELTVAQFVDGKVSARGQH